MKAADCSQPSPTGRYTRQLVRSRDFPPYRPRRQTARLLYRPGPAGNCCSRSRRYSWLAEGAAAEAVEDWPRPEVELAAGRKRPSPKASRVSRAVSSFPPAVERVFIVKSRFVLNPSIGQAQPPATPSVFT